MAVGRMAYDAGFYDQAVRHFRMALALVEPGGLTDSLRARSMTDLAKSLSALGKFDEAEQLIHEALKIDEGQKSYAERAEDYHQLSLLYWRSGRKDASLRFAKMAFELAQKAGGDVPDELKAKLLKHFAVLSEQAGNLADAERYLNQAIDFIEGSSQLGKHSMIYGDVLLVKVLFLAEQGRYDEAEELYPHAIQIVEMTRGIHHPRVAEALSIFKEMGDGVAELDDDTRRKIEAARNSSRHGIV
ncbi:MAG TPA: tetratricopeptide repeat protein [Candidatus Obscuribacterales bacterium]